MSDTFFNESFRNMYSDVLRTELQQKGSVLLDKVTIEMDLKGKNYFMDQVQKRTAKKKSGRLENHEITSPETERRKIVPQTIYDAIGIDKFDEPKMVVNPDSKYIVTQKYAIGRSIDEDIYDAARGTAYTGETGGTSVTLPSTSKIAHGSSGLTFAKINDALEILNDAHVSQDEDKFMLVCPRQIKELLSLDEITNIDYATKKSLYDGMPGRLLGFTFVPFDKNLTYSTGTTTITRYLMAFTRSAIGWGYEIPLFTRIDELKEKHYAKQIYSALSGGATRLIDGGVVEIACQE